METLNNRSLRRKRLYRGFSLYNFQENRTTRTYDVECVKIELLNHIYTRKGSRWMMPRFGTSIPDLIMEPLDEGTIDYLESELRGVIEYDPRVEFFDEGSLILRADPDNHTVTVAMLLRYIELDYVDRLTLNIEFGN